MQVRPKILIQGNDFKARQWMADFEEGAVIHFVTLQELFTHTLKRGRKIVIIRYLNSNRTWLSDLLHVLLLLFLGLTKFWHQSSFVWILHNIDKETVDTRPFLTQLKRFNVRVFSTRIFVMDEYFRKLCFPDNSKYAALSFGRKYNGAISPENLKRIKSFAGDHDQLVLCLGANGAKYRHFAGLATLDQHAKKYGISLGFILPPGQSFDGGSVLEVEEPNIDESMLTPYVDFIYRINDDISMPYTLYAACQAKIPIVTSTDFFTYQIVQHYGIGFSESAWFNATNKEKETVFKNMEEFLAQKSWNSLADALCRDFPDYCSLRQSKPS